jgi:hypothetical protein
LNLKVTIREESIKLLESLKSVRVLPNQSQVTAIAQNIITTLRSLEEEIDVELCIKFVKTLAQECSKYEKWSDIFIKDNDSKCQHLEAELKALAPKESALFDTEQADKLEYLKQVKALVATVSTWHQAFRTSMLEAIEQVKASSSRSYLIYDDLATIDTRLSETLSHEIKRGIIYSYLRSKFGAFITDKEAKESDTRQASFADLNKYTIPHEFARLLESPITNFNEEQVSEEGKREEEDWKKMLEVNKQFQTPLKELIEQCIKKGSAASIEEETAAAKASLAQVEKQLAERRQANAKMRQDIANLGTQKQEAAAALHDTVEKLATEAEQKDYLRAEINRLKGEVADCEGLKQKLSQQAEELQRALDLVTSHHQAMQLEKENELGSVKKDFKTEEDACLKLSAALTNKTKIRDSLLKAIKDSVSIQNIGAMLENELVEDRKKIDALEVEKESLLKQQDLLEQKKKAK